VQRHHRVLRGPRVRVGALPRVREHGLLVLVAHALLHGPRVRVERVSRVRRDRRELHPQHRLLLVVVQRQHLPLDHLHHVGRVHHLGRLLRGLLVQRGPVSPRNHLHRDRKLVLALVAVLLGALFGQRLPRHHLLCHGRIVRHRGRLLLRNLRHGHLPLGHLHHLGLVHQLGRVLRGLLVRVGPLPRGDVRRVGLDLLVAFALLHGSLVRVGRVPHVRRDGGELHPQHRLLLVVVQRQRLPLDHLHHHGDVLYHGRLLRGLYVQRGRVPLGHVQRPGRDLQHHRQLLLGHVFGRHLPVDGVYVYGRHVLGHVELLHGHLLGEHLPVERVRVHGRVVRELGRLLRGHVQREHLPLSLVLGLGRVVYVHGLLLRGLHVFERHLPVDHRLRNHGLDLLVAHALLHGLRVQLGRVPPVPLARVDVLVHVALLLALHL